MERFVKKFWTEEDGNATLDWMVLTAGLVLLGAAFMATLGSGSASAHNHTSDVIAASDVRADV